MAILECMRPARPSLGISQIAELLGMSRSTTHRYVITLQALGYLKQGSDRRYGLALGVVDLGLGAMNATGLVDQARWHMQELSLQSGFPVSLGVLDGPEVVVLGHETAPSARRAGLRVRPDSLPVYCTAMGKALLAALPFAEQARVLGEISLRKHTANTITSKRALRVELAQIQEGVLAVEDGEFIAGSRSIAAGVRSISGEVRAALAITAPASTISVESLADHMGSHLVSAAARVAARLGYRRPDEANV